MRHIKVDNLNMFSIFQEFSFTILGELKKINKCNKIAHCVPYCRYMLGSMIKHRSAIDIESLTCEQRCPI